MIFLNKFHQFLFVRIFSFLNIYLQRSISAKKQKHFATLEDERLLVWENYKRELELLEIGIGEGPDLKYYPSCNLTSIEPNAYFEKKFHSNYFPLQNKFKRVKFIQGVAEDMGEVETGSIDVVIMSWVLCSVSDTSKALKEVHRVLRPGGRFYFFEHTLYQREDFPCWARAQKYLQPIWTFLSCGCCFRPEVRILIEKASGEENLFRIDKYNFSYETIQSKWLQWFMFPIVPHTYGVATKI